ncbi:MAG: PEP-CTERM sorting domain-containing protein [Tannerellaceae bacterium]|nr:PEP-CTERM sorting domain-containing protein [Tannerellaceae bacterium]
MEEKLPYKEVKKGGEKMKRFVAVFLALFLIVGFSTIAVANLIVNPSFESWNMNWSTPDFYNWKEYGNWGPTSFAHTGSMAVMLRDNADYGSDDYAYSSLVSDKLGSLDYGTYEFGAWFQLKSNVDPSSPDFYNDDKPGVTMNVYWEGGGAMWPYVAYTFESAPVTWTYVGNPYYGYLSEWILIQGTFDVTAAVSDSEMNISIQNWSPYYSVVHVDDAFLQRVPEPSSLLFLGVGLLGLVGLRRKE